MDAATEITSSLRYSFAIDTIKTAGELALSYFSNLKILTVEKKGHQDLVSEADKQVEAFIREKLKLHFPNDQIVGEEGGSSLSQKNEASRFVWVIDPIDGTANFVSGIPCWTIVISLVENNNLIAGFIFDPIYEELYIATLGGGAFCNERAIFVSQCESIKEGSIAVGFSNRSKPGFINNLVHQLVKEGGMFYRNASGALSLAYVAAGKLLGYCEDHMNAWDCLAGQLLVKEAGGIVEKQNVQEVLVNGGRVIAATPAIFKDLRRITEKALE